MIENIGNTATDEGDGVTLTDVFSPILSNVAVYLNGTLLSEGTDYTYDETSGTFATVPAKISVPAATFTQGASGEWSTAAGSATLVVVGTV